MCVDRFRVPLPRVKYSRLAQKEPSSFDGRCHKTYWRICLRRLVLFRFFGGFDVWKLYVSGNEPPGYPETRFLRTISKAPKEFGRGRWVILATRHGACLFEGPDLLAACA